MDQPEFFCGVRPDIPRPGASILKLPLNEALWKNIAEGNLDPDKPIKTTEIHKTDFPALTGAFQHEEETLSLRLVSTLSLAVSDNPASDYLLDQVGMEGVNRRARALGAHNTHMEVSFQDQYLGEQGRKNRTTARDALTLLLPFLEEEYLEEPRRALANNLRNQRIPLRLPEGVVVWHKTGSLQGVANDVGVVAVEGRRLGISILTDQQADTAHTNLEIGRLARSLWQLAKKL